MYAQSVPYLLHNLNVLAGLLRKAESHCEARKIDPAVMLSMRLYPDMFNLTRQVQLATDFAKGASARLAAVEIPSYADDETTFEGLQARLAKTVAFLQSLPEDKFAGADSRTVTLKIGGQERNLKGLEYFNGVALPNFYFHMATAYDILRHNGVELGKRDFLGRS